MGIDCSFVGDWVFKAVYMESLGLICLCFIVLSLYIGNEGSFDFEIALEIKSFKNPYYELGVSFRAHDIEGDENMIEQELIVGLFFVNVIVTFTKNRT